MDATRIGGWEALQAAIFRPFRDGGLPTAVGLDLSNYGDPPPDLRGNRPPQIEVSLYSDKPFAERNGYVFDDLTPEALESALDRALGLWFDYPEYFRQLRLNGMAMDSSWARPARQYLDIFEKIRAKPPDGP